MATPVLLFAPSPAHAISDDANPWLAIENAICIRHRTLDYTVGMGSPVHFKTVEWKGAVDGFPTHCHLAGDVQGVAFDIRLPGTWNREVITEGCNVGEVEKVVEALHGGAAVAFGPATPFTHRLLVLVTSNHYGFLASPKTELRCD